ncbi:LysR family transcriptional regulator [Limibacillus halophilus]|nr:LysR family transcriptional regulator [Limibacillus halophilus]
MRWHDLPSLSSLRAFESAARNRSFSKAGREMNVTHAAVAQQVRRLEEWLGVGLLFREGRGLSLTADGKILAEGLLEGFSQIAETIEMVASGGRDRPLNISMTPSFAVSWLMPRIGEFRTKHPSIELMLNPSVDVVDFRRDTIDLAIRYGDGDWPGLISAPFIPARFTIVAAKSLVQDRKIDSPQDLQDLPWLQEMGTREALQWLESQGVDLSSRKLNVTHLPGYMLLSALRAGQGVACTTSVWVEEDIAAGHLVSLYQEDSSKSYHIVHRPSVLRPEAKIFIDWMKQTERRDRQQATTSMGGE